MSKPNDMPDVIYAYKLQTALNGNYYSHIEGEGKESYTKTSIIAENNVPRELVEQLIEAAEHFVWKCENGRARSKESYKQFKDALASSQSGSR